MTTAVINDNAAVETDALRVLIVDLSLGFGGASSRVLTLLKQLPAGSVALAGLENAMVTRYARQYGFPVHIVGKRKTDPMILPNLIRLIRQGHFQVIDTQNIQSKVWASLAAAFTGKTLVSTLNSWYLSEHGGSLKGKVYQRLELMTNWGLDLCILVSTLDYKHAVEHVPANLLALNANAVEMRPEDFPQDKDWLLERFQLPQDVIICTAVGRLVWPKGYPDLIDAVAELTPVLPNLYCLIVGQGELEAELQTQIDTLGLGERVRLVGYLPREDALAIVRASDLFVMPSRHEGTPLALLEAAALEKPIVTTSAGGIPDLVTDGVHALLSAPQNPAAFAQNIRRLCEDSAFRQQLASQARELVAQNFSAKEQAVKMTALYQRACQHSQNRRTQR